MIRNHHPDGFARDVHGDDRAELLECILWRGMEDVFQPEISQGNISFLLIVECLLSMAHKMLTYLDRNVLFNLYWHVMSDWHFHWVWNICAKNGWN